MRPISLLCSTLFLAVGLALPAAAATITLSKQGTATFGSNGHASVKVSETGLGMANVNTSAYGYALKGKLNGLSVENFTAWNLDIATDLHLPSKYSTTSSPFTGSAISSATLSNIERLFETGYKTMVLTSDAQAAGFQLALWEVLYEKSGIYDLSKGNFRATHSIAIAAGQALLAGMTGPVTQAYNLTFLQSDDSRGGASGHYSRNLVTVAAVPLPAGAVLLISGLGGFAALRRRKARKA